MKREGNVSHDPAFYRTCCNQLCAVFRYELPTYYGAINGRIADDDQLQASVSHLRKHDS